MEMNRSISAHPDCFALSVKQSSATSEWPMDSGLKSNPGSTAFKIQNIFIFMCQIETTVPFNRFISRYKSSFFFLTAFLLLLFRERLIPWPWNIIFFFDFLAKQIGSWRDDHCGWVSFIRKLFSFLSYLLRYRAYTALAPDLESLSQAFKI